MGPIYVATGDALVRLEDGVALTALAGHGIRCLAGADGSVFAGGRDGVWRQKGAPDVWQRCALAGDVFALAVGADATLYAGLEPSALHASDDEGESWRELDALQRIPSRPTWSFPPRPWTSHVRAIAPSPHDAALVLVGIELGGLMRSSDGGESWEDHRPGAQRDVHALAWHPRERGRAYEAGGGGAALSLDGGDTWQPVDDGRDRHYTWALAVDPDDADTWFVSASTGPYAAHGGGDPQARVYRRRGREPWQALPAPTHAMPYALDFGSDGSLVATLADGSVHTSGDRGDSWDRVAVTGEPPVAAIALLTS